MLTQFLCLSPWILEQTRHCSLKIWICVGTHSTNWTFFFKKKFTVPGVIGFTVSFFSSYMHSVVLILPSDSVKLKILMLNYMNCKLSQQCLINFSSNKNMKWYMVFDDQNHVTLNVLVLGQKFKITTLYWFSAKAQHLISTPLLMLLLSLLSSLAVSHLNVFSILKAWPVVFRCSPSVIIVTFSVQIYVP